MTATVQMKLDESSPRSAYGPGGAQIFANLIEVEFRRLQSIVTKPVNEHTVDGNSSSRAVAKEE